MQELKMIIIPKLKLGYQNIPKVATTSLFSWLYHFHANSEAEEEKARKYFLSGKNSITLKNTLEDIHEYKDYFKFAITRDPIKRFLSMYSNRVVYHR